MEWAQKRQVYYAGFFATVVFPLVIFFTYLLVHKTPTCFDQKQNGREAGIDCGGPCARYCATQVKPLNVVWVKAFPFAPGHYDVGAYVENPNKNAGIPGMRYTMRIFDQDKKLVGERNGTIDIIPGAPTMIFEGNFRLEKDPLETQIEFTSTDMERWTKALPLPSSILTKTQSLTNIDAVPRFEVTFVNTDLVNNTDNIIVGAVIYNSLQQPIAVSRTFINRIEKGGSYQTVFTWPNALPHALEGERFTTGVVVMPSVVFER